MKPVLKFCGTNSKVSTPVSRRDNNDPCYRIKNNNKT